MSFEYKNDDFILQLDDNSAKVLSIVNKYDAFLDAFTTPDFGHVREAIQKAIHFLVSEKYENTEQLAEFTYKKSQKLQMKYPRLSDYLRHIQIKHKKSISIDLATGTGKSWVIYGVAQIMLAEGLVDKVLVLCPSLTIEEELKKKFDMFSGNAVLTKILTELGALYVSPAIKSANDPILNGDICVENIHAAYERTGSSIKDSFKGKGRRSLVISDEAHHIYSAANSDVKRWHDFLVNPDYDFYYLLGLSGTPYIGDEYFHDIIYRYSLRQAMEDGIIKKIDYKVEEESNKDKGFDETYQNHISIQGKYLGILKPISIIVTDKIVTCIQVWNDLVKYIADKESLSFDECANKVIWVTSGLPSNASEKAVIDSILSDAEKIRKGNISLLKTVDENENPVEWIVSVSMLTEGWDVKNVFQIVPHEQRAFNSKLLISQVLGRGLRVPKGVSQPVHVKINNHEKWTLNIVNLYKEILEIENRITWGFDESQKQYVFPLFKLKYISYQDTTEIKDKPSKEPEKVRFSPQSLIHDETSIYSETGSFQFTVETKDIVTIEQAARQIKLFLKEKDESISKKWPLNKIKEFITSNLEERGYDSSFISKENLTMLKQSFGPMLRERGKETIRMKMRPDLLQEVRIEEMASQSVSESSIKRDGYIFYSDNSTNILPEEQKLILSGFLADKENYEKIKESVTKYGDGSEDSIKFLKENLIPIDLKGFKTPLNLIFVSYEPEYRFTRSIFNNIDLFDSILKSPDKGFYYFPYSYKPTDEAITHTKQENFNPDFFIKLKDKKEILVIEIKTDADSVINARNKAKYREGINHFTKLNEELKKQNIDWTYHFYFLSREDYTDFFQAVRDDKYIGWKSQLMQSLS